MHTTPTTPNMPSATSQRRHHNSTIGLLSSLMRRLLKLLISCILMPAMQHHIHVNWSPMSTSPTSSLLAHASTISLSLSLSATNSTTAAGVSAPTAELDVGMAAVAAAALSGLGARAPASWSVAASHMRLTQRNNHANISELLDNLLRGYDNSIRPGFGGPPATVEVDIMVRSMGPISEVDMTYSMDCYFRQSWVDKRLAFKGAQDTLALSVSMLARIWKPDTYFYNGKQSYLHTITTPNKFVRIYQNGRVLYSSRLTIKAGCPMNLEDFPMDIQKCPLKFGSFGYTTADVVYRWNRERPAVAIAEDMKLSQFDLVDCPAGNLTDVIYKAAAPHDATHNSNKPGNTNRNGNNYYNKNANRKNQKYGSKTMSTFAGPGAKNQHVRGTGLQLDKGEKVRRKRGRVGFDMSDEDDEEAHLRGGEEPTPHRGSGKRRMSFYRREELEARRKGKRVPQYNSVSKIDRASRIVFPMLFLLINVFYWYGYLSRSSRILANTPTTT
ncbi:gamma-aminobutyric acid receptor alpha-like [Zeugodacus cucurbitae]|uniref:gamma-aminobutyric acid receptor alpha-like n=1 Tax=Zeugodacus cucurbitae TaxID=28588 RepID=UPI00059697FA|nr:gamma-aminobutyric acid receptor alpha-like [Zeugodacus cucurbitae]